MIPRSWRSSTAVAGIALAALVALAWAKQSIAHHQDRGRHSLTVGVACYAAHDTIKGRRAWLCEENQTGLGKNREAQRAWLVFGGSPV